MTDENVAGQEPADEPQVIPESEAPEGEAEAQQPEGGEEEQQTEGQESESEEGDGEEAGPEEDEEEPKPKRKRPGKYQRTVQRLEQRLEQQDEILRALARQAGGGQQQPQQQAQEAPRPKQDDFQDYGEYLRADAEWVAEKKAREIISQERATYQRSQREQGARAVQAQYGERLEDARDKYEDFDDVAFDNSVPITDAMANAIMTAENGPDVQYYLGSHPDEAKKISRMDPYSQVRAIGRLEAKLSTPSPKKTTSAPKPVKPLGGTATGGVGSDDPSKMSMEEYASWRHKQGV